MITKSTSLDALAAKYALLKHQISQLEVEAKQVAKELLIDMNAGDKIETPEYNVTCYPGKSSVCWTKAGEAHKKKFENTLIAQGLMDIKIGDLFVQVRFTKQVDHE